MCVCANVIALSMSCRPTTARSTVHRVCVCVCARFKNSRELFDGYKHKIQLEYVEMGVLEGLQDGCDDCRPELNVLCQLVVNNVVSDDCGDVECRAVNKGGIDSTRAQLHVRGF